ncbi:MAG: cell division FtsA domain-containing protein [Candidatus Peregrinibacteria bacterium]|nr:cell division FtsA domain-containing protein [Candidatus Peregrinibacteria bacterium]
MFRFLKSKIKHAGNTLLSLDIGTEFVKALVVQFDAEGKGRILGVGKSRQKIGEMQSGAVTDIASVIEHCKEAIAEAERVSSIVPDQLVMGIAGELVKGANRTIRYRRHEPHLKIHFEELKNIVHKVQWKAFEQIRSELAHETGFNEIDVKLVSAAIVDVQVDGYRVSNPIGFQGKDVIMTVFNAFAPLIHYGVLQTIAAELDISLLAITVEPYGVGRCLEGSPDQKGQNAIFIDVGGGTTDIAVVKDGNVVGTKIFTIGGRSFTKRISQNLNVSFSEAEEIKLAYAANRLEKQSHKIVQDTLKSDCDVWLTGITLTLSEFTSVEQLPSKIFLCGGGSHLPEIKTILSQEDWWKSLSFPRKPHVSFLHPQDLPNITDETNLLHDPQDITPMALAKLGIELASEEKILTKILRKVVRLMQV